MWYFCILLLVIYMLAVADKLPPPGKRELICLLLFTCNCVVSVRRDFLFFWVLGDGLRYFIVALHGPSIYLFCFLTV